MPLALPPPRSPWRCPRGPCPVPSEGERPVPGVAGEAGADDGVQHSQGHVVVPEGGAHQRVRERIGTVGDGRAWGRKGSR